MIPLAQVVNGSLQVYLSPGQVAVDIGANAGAYTRKFSDVVGPTGLVIACEPLPDTFAKLQETCAKFTNVQLHNVGLDAQVGERDLYRGKNSEQCSFWPDNVPKKERAQPYTVKTTTLDALLSGVPEVHGIKIDTQGAEMAVLQGATETLKRPETIWMLEVWPDGLEAAGSSLEALVDLLQAAGLQVIAEGKDPQTRDTLCWGDILKTRRGGHHHTNIIWGTIYMTPSQPWHSPNRALPKRRTSLYEFPIGA